MTSRDLCPHCQSEMTVVFEARRRSLTCPKCDEIPSPTGAGKAADQSKH